MRRLVIGLVIVGCASLAARPAAADTWGGGSGATNPWVYVVQPGQPLPGGAGPGESDGGTGVVTCVLYQALAINGGFIAGLPVSDPQPGSVYLLWCRDGAGATVVFRVITYDPATFFIDPGALAQQAYKELPLVYPNPQTSPGMWTDQLVGVSTWLWIPSNEWQPPSATASAGGLSATVTATPDRVVWTMGDGAIVVCDGPGVPYDTSRPDAEQSTDCSHTYPRSSAGQSDERYAVSAVMVWTVRWTATDGSGGALPEAWRGAQFSLRVAEAQALRTAGAGG